MIASIGFWLPCRTRSTISSALCPCAPATASVPITIIRFGVATARLIMSAFSFSPFSM